MILTIRVIKSFEFRTVKNVILRDIQPSMTVKQLKSAIDKYINDNLKPFQNVSFDTLKIYVKAHGSKTTNLVINLNHEDWFLNDSDTLLDSGVENETEISYFCRNDYDLYKSNPQDKW